MAFLLLTLTPLTKWESLITLNISGMLNQVIRFRFNLGPLTIRMVLIRKRRMIFQDTRGSYVILSLRTINASIWETLGSVCNLIQLKKLKNTGGFRQCRLSLRKSFRLWRSRFRFLNNRLLWKIWKLRSSPILLQTPLIGIFKYLTWKMRTSINKSPSLGTWLKTSLGEIILIASDCSSA